MIGVGVQLRHSDLEGMTVNDYLLSEAQITKAATAYMGKPALRDGRPDLRSHWALRFLI